MSDSPLFLAENIPAGGPESLLSPEQTEAFRRDGALVVRGAFAGWVDTMADGIARNIASPGPHASENSVSRGRFFDDYCNWQRIPEFERVIRESPAARIAAEAMGSPVARIFHDHVLVKEPGTPKPTPWHQDAPYYFIEGRQTVSLWLPLDPVQDASLRLIAGSHLWNRMVRPTRWSDESDFYDGPEDWTPVPDPDTDPQDMQVLEWAMQPGDAVLFDFRTVHGARGNLTTRRRRALSLRFVGADARYVQRPGRTSPPFAGHGMQTGDTLRDDWFPVVWPR